MNAQYDFSESHCRNNVIIIIYLSILLLFKIFNIHRPGQGPHGLRFMSSAVRLMRLWVRIPPGEWMSLCCEFCECCQVAVSAAS